MYTLRAWCQEDFCDVCPAEDQFGSVVGAQGIGEKLHRALGFDYVVEAEDGSVVASSIGV